MREIAARVEITERAAQRIVADLIDLGYVERERAGRRNVYTVRRDRPVPLVDRRDVDLSALLDLLLTESSGARAP
jgi:hypothetical protein